MEFDTVKISEITTLNKKIYKLYEKLSELEKNGKKNTNEYKEILKYIELVREYNMKYVDSFIDVDFFDVDEFSNYVIHRWYLDLDYFNSSKENVEILRMFFFTTLKASKENKNINTNNFFVDAFDDDGNITKQEIMRTDDVIKEASIQNDFMYLSHKITYKCFAQLIEDKIKKTRNKELRNKYIDFKYKLIYVLPYLESDFLINQKNYTENIEELTTISLLRANDPIGYEETYMDFQKNRITGIFSEMAELDDEKTEDLEDVFQLELKELFIKACVNSSVNPDYYMKDYEYLKDQILETTESKKAKKYINRALKRSKIKAKNVD
jgi:hypothetical protein